MSLKARVVLLVVIMLVAGIWALALSVTRALERDLTELLSASFSTEVVNLAADLDRDFRMYINVLDRLAASLTPEILADPAKLHHALDQFSDTSVIVPNACFTADGKGIVIAGYPEDAVSLGASIAERDYFLQVMASGQPVIGAPLTGRTAQHAPAVPIAVPLRDGSGVTAGVLVGSVLLSDPLIFGQLEQTKIGKMGWFLVVSPKDRVIVAATDRQRILKTLPGHGVIPLLDRRLEEGYEGPGVTVASIGPEVLSVSRKMATTGWVVIAADPTEEVFAPIKDIKRRIYLAALLISLVVGVVLRFVLARQFAPLTEAGRAMRRMTEGRIPLAPIPVARPDEIGELIGNFNRLAQERSRLDESLRAEIAERKLANEALRESKDRLDGIYLSVGDGIVSADEAQRIVLFNSAAERMFGHSAAAVIGQPVSVLLPERFRTRHEQHVLAFGATGQSTRTMGAYGMIYGLRANGEEFPLEASVSQSGVSPNKLFTVILRDITERRQAEQMREQLMRQLELLSERLATAQEEERRTIAYELHEELGQELATLKLYLQMFEPGSRGAGTGTPHEEALAVAVHATERVRKLVMDLAPPELEDFGLQTAVRTYCQRKALAGGWKLQLDAPEFDLRAPQPVERACFRVLQEGLSNVLDHAKATEVWVQLHQGAGELELTIRDNGIGFDRASVSEDHRREGGSLGLFGMQIRAKHVGGALEIKSSVGAGTEIRAVFPLRGT